MKARRVAVWGLLLALLAAGIVYALRPQAVPVDLARAEAGPIRISIDDEGQTRVRDVYTLYSPLGGRLYRIEAEVGDPVEANMTELARIEPAPPAFLDVRTEAERRAAVEAARAARDLAEAEVERAQADHAFAASELDRARRLIRQQTISQRALDDAERAERVARANVATAKAALNVREHELEQARSQVLSRQEMERRSGECECIPVTAPVSGVVLRVIRKSESVIEAGTALLEIGDPRDLEVVADFLSEDAVRIEPGQAAVVAGWGGPELAAVVRRVEPFGRTEISALGIEEQRVDVILDFADPPARWQRLGHGYRVDVSVTLLEIEGLRLPLGALFRNGGGWAVFTAEAGRARLRPVEVGQRNSLWAEIRSGLSPGQPVVLYPSDRIAEGVRVTQRQAR